MNDYKMTPGELRATWGLGTVFSLRMLGMFMVLPVLTTYGMALQGASEALIGLAIGIYGLAQAVFQVDMVGHAFEVDGVLQFGGIVAHGLQGMGRDDLLHSKLRQLDERAQIVRKTGILCQYTHGVHDHFLLFNV